MKVTEKLLRRKFNEFNKDFFNEELPYAVHLYPYDKLDSIGRFYPPIDGEYGIMIRSQYNYTEDEIDTLLLHEMCHMYLFVKGIVDDSNCSSKEEAHGEEFIKLAARIGEESGLNLIDGLDKQFDYLPGYGEKYCIISFNRDKNRVFIEVINKQLYKVCLKNGIKIDNLSIDNEKIEIGKVVLCTVRNSILDEFEVTENGDGYGWNIIEIPRRDYEQYIKPTLRMIKKY